MKRGSTINYSRNSPEPWLKLNWQVPFTPILNEFHSIQDKLLVHRPQDGHKDWHAVTLYGYSSKETNSHWEYRHTKSKKKTTEVGLLCPLTMKWVFSLPFSRIDDVRFLVLRPGGFIKAHVDVAEQNWLDPVNIAIDWPEGCRLAFTKHGPVPYTTGTAFVLNIHYEHSAENYTNRNRVNLLIHGKKKDEFWDDITLSGKP